MLAEGALRDRLGAGHFLIETLRYEPGTGFVRLERHLARMAGSARAFAIAFDRDRAEEALKRAATGSGPLRMRLTLAADGTVAASAAPFPPPAADACWRLAVARTRIRSDDPVVRHKTTHRATYDRARAEFSPGEADEVVLLNERGEVCEGTIANLFLDDGTGTLRTPAIGCGLLPGILRSELLESGRAREAVVGLAALQSAPMLFMGNSLRGLVRARLSDLPDGRLRQV